MNLNKALPELLWRLPGVGTKSVEGIVPLRCWHRLRMEDLVRLRLPLRKVLPFVVTDRSAHATVSREKVWQQFTNPSPQLDLLPSEASVVTGQL
jgi:predicted DNA-binding helix-hairpin-helix protein